MIPLKDNVIVKKAEKNLVTASGIVLQRSDEADLADVVAIGSDVEEVSVDDKVLIDWNQAIKIDKENYKISVENIIAVIE